VIVFLNKLFFGRVQQGDRRLARLHGGFRANRAAADKRRYQCQRRPHKYARPRIFSHQKHEKSNLAAAYRSVNAACQMREPYWSGSEVSFVRNAFCFRATLI
jgi:hypothetical protein